MRMKANVVRDMSVKELTQKLTDLKEELFHLKFQHSTNQLDNPQRIVAVKKDIARVNTILREKELKESK